MAFGERTITDFAGGIGDILGGITASEALGLKAKGSRVEAGDYRLASTLAGENEQFTEQSTQIKQTMADRQIYMGIGAETAEIAGAGFQTNTGTALDLLRSSASQGAIQKALIGQQGLITEEGYKVQQQTFNNLAAYADMAADTQDKMAGQASLFGNITGGLKIAAGLATFL